MFGFAGIAAEAAPTQSLDLTQSLHVSEGLHLSRPAPLSRRAPLSRPAPHTKPALRRRPATHTGLPTVGAASAAIRARQGAFFDGSRTGTLMLHRSILPAGRV